MLELVIQLINKCNLKKFQKKNHGQNKQHKNKKKLTWAEGWILLIGVFIGDQKKTPFHNTSHVTFHSSSTPILPIKTIEIQLILLERYNFIEVKFLPSTTVPKHNYRDNREKSFTEEKGDVSVPGKIRHLRRSTTITADNSLNSVST